MAVPEDANRSDPHAGRFFVLGVCCGLLTAVLWGAAEIGGGWKSGEDWVFIAVLVGGLTFLATLVSLGIALLTALLEWRRRGGRFPWVIVLTSIVVIAPFVVAFLLSLFGDATTILREE
jgi:hypothetical protein